MSKELYQMKETVTVYGANGAFPYEIPIISQEEWDRIKGKKKTPDMVSVSGHIYLNEYTCNGGFDGTCNCFSHPRKSWREYHRDTRSWGDIVYSE